MFEGQTVVITGGSSGIGKSLARAFLAAGANVTIVGHQAQHLQEALEELKEVSGSVSALQCDVSDLSQVREMVVRQLETGSPDILINNAGYATYTPVEQASSEEIEHLIGVNLLGAMYVTREFLQSMIARGRGRIVNISSVAGKLIITPNASYCAAKHGLVAWSEALSAEVHRFGITVQVVCPGRVETPFFDHPSFAARPASRLTGFTVPLERVIRATMDALSSDRFLTYVPRWFGLATWMNGLAPPVARRLVGHWNRSRIAALYDRVPP
jgi:2-hydroxycyclohexanecarboxyl-CoA dehydrogenase